MWARNKNTRKGSSVKIAFRSVSKQAWKVKHLRGTPSGETCNLIKLKSSVNIKCKLPATSRQPLQRSASTRSGLLTRKSLLTQEIVCKFSAKTHQAPLSFTQLRMSIVHKNSFWNLKQQSRLRLREEEIFFIEFVQRGCRNILCKFVPSRVTKLWANEKKFSAAGVMWRWTTFINGKSKVADKKNNKTFRTLVQPEERSTRPDERERRTFCSSKVSVKSHPTSSHKISFEVSALPLLRQRKSFILLLYFKLH